MHVQTTSLENRGAPAVPHRIELNAWTIGAIAVVAYALAVQLHEAVGHGGACIWMGGHPLILNAIFLSYDTHGVSTNAVRVIAAGGCVVNLLTGLLGLSILRWGKPRGSLRYFLWLFSAVSVLIAFGYVMFSGISGFGDWIPVTRGWGPPALTRVALTLIGAFLYFIVAPKLLVPEVIGMLDPSAPLSAQIKRLVRLPYFVGGIAVVIAALPNPGGLKLVLLSAAAASFGGTSFLLLHPIVKPGAELTAPTSEPLKLKASPAWIVAAVLAYAVFAGVLGRGWRF